MSYFVTRLMQYSYFICFVILIVNWSNQVDSKSSNAVIENIIDVKDLKKLLRTKNNVLICYINSSKKSSSIVKVFRDAAESIKGEGTMVLIDCSGEAKKMCKKMKISTDSYLLKHYKDGEFHKDYDRKETKAAMLNFMRDPAGDVPWDEDESTSDIHHLADVAALMKLIKRQPLPVMVMFYAPWCGFCKQLKPDYGAAAAELKGEGIMAAIDVNRPENSIVRSQFNITGFPTLLYFENGAFKMIYEGENKKQNLIDFMKDPRAVPEKPKEEEWSDSENDVIHLTSETFETVLAESESALVMFYAPWCGHCKRMKPDYEEAATILKDSGSIGILAAVDATKERDLSKKFEVKGFPTIKYFTRGEFKYDVSLRDKAKILEFMKDPREPPPPPPPEAPWADEPSEVLHLGTDDFKPVLRKRKHALVMFYAPWCGHCKKAKPEYTDAAEVLKEDPRVALAAVDCTIHATLCKAYDVSGYPTFKFFHYLNKEPMKDYNGGRLKNDFLRHMAPFTSVDLTHIKPEEKSPGDDWKPKNVKILDDKNFDSFIKSEPSLLVLFYAPWCGHCKKIKEPYDEAGSILRKSNVSGKLAAIDVNTYTSLGEKYAITGYPTLKYFRSGEFVSAYDGGRSTESLVKFMESAAKENPSRLAKGKDEL